MTRRCGIDRGARVIVALSGGADSVALLAALCAVGYDCHAAHCNFHLRGAESNRDMAHAARVATAIGADLSVRHFESAEYARDRGISLEMACRELRYRWFDSLADEVHATAIAVGHHREDQAETVMLNLLRGTGIAGMTGMAWLNGHIARPMLDLSRTDIESYLAEKGLAYVDDSSNAQFDFRRNRLRNIVLPTMEEQFPGAMDAILTTASNLADTERLYRLAIRRLASEAVNTSTGTINVGRLADNIPPREAATLVFELIRPYGFNATHAANILSSVRSTEATHYESATYKATLSHGILTFSATDAPASAPDAVGVSLRRDILSPVHIAITGNHISEFAPVRDSRIVYLDAATLDGNPRFELRHWRRGDRFRPFGMQGTRLVSDLFSDAHFTPTQKAETWLLTRNGDILWVVGLRAAAAFAITPATRTFLRLQLL